VLSAANGPEAIAVWEKNPAPIDLLLTDMVMPSGMSGGELAKELVARNPKLKIIYTSGYSPEILKQDSLLLQGINFLPKPYDLPSLLKAIRLCLDGANCRNTKSAPARRKPPPRPSGTGILPVRRKKPQAKPAAEFSKTFG